MGVTFVFRSTVLFSSSLHALPHSAFRASLPVFTGFICIILHACGLAREYHRTQLRAAPRSRPFLRFPGHSHAVAAHLEPENPVRGRGARGAATLTSRKNAPRK